MIASARG